MNIDELLIMGQSRGENRAAPHEYTIGEKDAPIRVSLSDGTTHTHAGGWSVRDSEEEGEGFFHEWGTQGYETGANGELRIVFRMNGRERQSLDDNWRPYSETGTARVYAPGTWTQVDGGRSVEKAGEMLPASDWWATVQNKAGELRYVEVIAWERVTQHEGHSLRAWLATSVPSRSDEFPEMSAALTLTEEPWYLNGYTRTRPEVPRFAF